MPPILSALTLADATADDIAGINNIYRYYVENTLVSLEDTSPSLEELNGRRLHSQERGLPYLVAKQGNEVIGFCYASPYRTRSGYRFTVENSVYLSTAHRGQGLGTLLLGKLIERCTEQGYHQMVAVISHMENSPSIRLHSRLGFRTIGTVQGAGFKFDKWIDIVLMQRPLQG